MKKIIFALLLVPGLALAGGNHNNPPPQEPPLVGINLESDATAVSHAEGGDGGNGIAGALSGSNSSAESGDSISGSLSSSRVGDTSAESGDSISGAVSGSNVGDTSAESGDSVSVAYSGSESTASGNGGAADVEVNGPTYKNKSQALALALPGATADNGSSAPCLESRRGWTVLGVGASGRTRINDACFATLQARQEFEQCMLIADAYARIGRTDLLVRQLQQCGGLVVPEGIEPSKADVVTHEELNRAFEKAVSK